MKGQDRIGEAGVGNKECTEEHGGSSHILEGVWEEDIIKRKDLKKKLNLFEGGSGG